MKIKDCLSFIYYFYNGCNSINVDVKYFKNKRKVNDGN